MNTTTYLASKPRYEILDGLRGVAAMIVVAYHLFETYSAGPVHQILNHGYLAVDFFFVLSGFVIGYAYDDRWDRMSIKDFFKRRLVRLHPMVIMGTLIGAVFFYLGDCSAFPLIMETPWWKVLLMVLLGCLMIPTPVSWDIRGWWEVNSLNGPTWSLMWEYIANILYALFIRHFSKIALGIFVALAALLTIDIAFNIDTFGLLVTREAAAYTFIGGWSLTPDQLYIGISRLLLSFLRGATAFARQQTDKDKKRILLVLIADSCHFSYAPHRRYGSHVDEWCLRSFLCTYYVPFNSSNGSRQQCDGKTFRSHLPISRRDLLPSLYHTFSADLYADSLGTKSSGRTFRHACFACSFHLHFIHCYRICLP